mgnify:CR=1 FL=1
MGVRTTNNTSKRIKQILKNCNDFRKPLKIIAMDMRNQTLRNFDNEESYLGVKWKKSARAKRENGNAGILTEEEFQLQKQKILG